MSAHDTEIVDIADDHRLKVPVKLTPEVVHWLRGHDLHDLKKMMLEMHSAGEDITEYAAMLQELEKLQKALKLHGDLPATEEELDPEEYVEAEMREALAH